MSSSDDASDSHEIHEYPNCEDEDCYCLNHWPDRDGGKEKKVVDNTNNGKFTIRCQVSINNDPEIDSCHFCKYWMFSKCLSLCDEKEACFRCWKLIPLFPILKEVLDTTCKKCQVFPFYEKQLGKDEGIPRVLCKECHGVHVDRELEEEHIIPKNENRIKEALNEWMFEYDHMNKNNKEIAQQITKAFEEKYKEHEAIKKKEKEDELAKKRELEARCSQTRKRLLRTTLPLLASISDEHLEHVLPSKFMRLQTEQHVKAADQLIASPTHENILAFSKIFSEQQ